MDLLAIIIIILIDQGTKIIAKDYLQKISNIDIINKIFSLTYVENKGAAFGIFKGKKFLLIGVTSAVIIAMAYYLFKYRNNLSKLMRWSFILIISGAVGNLINRMFLGYVVDFFHIYIGTVFDWPVFNVADISVVTGTILLAFSILFDR